jgi:hypothetical protein
MYKEVAKLLLKEHKCENCIYTVSECDGECIYAKASVIITNLISRTDDQTQILDSGNRRQFESGAVRDIQEGKGRCDLLPLDVATDIYKFVYGEGSEQYIVLLSINDFITDNETQYLITALDQFTGIIGGWENMLLEVSKHFEEGAKKYGENNWQKGIPTHCYIDSAVRHYLKYLRGDKDEPHERAFVWNILCCIWTCKHKPELNDYNTGIPRERNEQ